MGGPWRARGFDPVAWRAPAARIEASGGAGGADGARDHLVGIVIVYLASVLTSVAITLTFLKNGW